MKLAALAAAGLLALAAACNGPEAAPASPSPAEATSAATAAPSAPTAQTAPTAPAASPKTPSPNPAPSPTETATPTRSPAPTTPTTATPTATPTATSTPTPTPTPSPTPAPTSTVAPAPGPVGLVPALGGRRFERPIELGAYLGGLLFVAEQDGRILLLDGAGESAGVLLDIRGRVSRSANEEGLLSVALDPAFAENGRLWVYYSVAGGPRRTRLSRFTTDPSGSTAADPDSELVVLEVEQPFANHNGGAVRFGPDGMLYLGFGDGGSGGDPQGNGQDPSTLLGTIIRIDVRDASAARPYAVPPDNPLLDTPGARPEVWAYGFRNPWRMAFDAETGALWVADVGQNAVEEIDVAERGGNHGWNRLEGDACYSPRSGCDAAGTVLPVATYRHDEGCSVSGGFVYRGASVPSIRGAYVYADFCSGRVWALAAGLGSAPVVIAESGSRIAAFGLAGDDVYLLPFDGPILRVVPLQ